MARLTNLISKLSLDMSPIWIPLIRLATHSKVQYDLTDSSWVSIRFYSWGLFLFHRWH
jgi:hypothetical protein